MPQVPARTVYEDPINFIRLEEDPYVLPEYSQSQHSHPFTISPEEMTEVLRGIQVRDYRGTVTTWLLGGAAWEPVFHGEEIALLAPRLSEALERAKPNERVTFYLSHPQTSIKREITSGGIYVKDHHLHFILGNYRIVYGIPAYGMVYDRRYPMRPTAPKGFEITFRPSTAVIHQESSLLDKMFGRAKDELVIDLRTLGLGPSVARVRS
ncbi:MAG: hypothetical protein ACREI3_00475 [Nitrospirales bacterium]